MDTFTSSSEGRHRSPENILAKKWTTGRDAHFQSKQGITNKGYLVWIYAYTMGLLPYHPLLHELHILSIKRESHTHNHGRKTSTEVINPFSDTNSPLLLTWFISGNSITFVGSSDWDFCPWWAKYTTEEYLLSSTIISSPDAHFPNMTNHFSLTSSGRL